MARPARTIGPSSCRRNSNSVTIPKLPPPPRMPQNRSSFSRSLARTTLPSARTTSAESRLSHVRPCLDEVQPRPPPVVKPPMPVVVMRPPGVCSPCSCVAASNSPHRTPPPARAVLASGSTSMRLRPPRSMTMPSSHTPSPDALCPPQRTATSRSASRAKFTAATTLAVPAQRAITAGRLSCMALKIVRASSYPASPGTIASPSSSARSASTFPFFVISDSPGSFRPSSSRAPTRVNGAPRRGVRLVDPLGTRRCRVACVASPDPADLANRRRVHDQVPERRDCCHVRVPQESVRLDQDRHLAAVAAGPVRHPAEVKDAVHGPVGDLGRKLVLEQVERGEGQRGEVRAGRARAQVRRQAVAERRHPGAEARARAVPAQQLSGRPPDRPQRAGRAGRVLRRVARGDPLHQPREVVRPDGRRKRPHVLEPEVGGELVDTPRPGGVRGVRKPHWIVLFLVVSAGLGIIHTCMYVRKPR